MNENTEQINGIIDTIEKIKQFDFSQKIPSDSNHLKLNTIATRLNEMSVIIENAISIEKQSKEIQACILKTLPANIALINNTGEITLTNEGWNNFGKQNGVHPEYNWIGLNYLSVSEPSDESGIEDGKNAADNLRKLLRGEIDHFAMEYPCHSPDKKRWFIIQARPIKINNEKGALVMHIDITERKLFEERQLQLNEELELKVKDRTLELTHLLEREKEINETKSRFITLVSHEFRTPLASILSSASLIEMYKESEQQENRLKHTNRITSSVKNLNDILEDFLSIEELERKNDELKQNTKINLPEFINGALKEFNRTVGEKKQEIIYSHEGEEIISNSEKILKNIIFNLLSNASKFSPKETKIQLSSALVNNTVSIIVKDQGIGIPEGDQGKLFDQFFRASNAANIQGTGLGLNIVKKYLELINGDITFISKLGEGTTFTIKFPK